jgi:hypothetical protein
MNDKSNDNTTRVSALKLSRGVLFVVALIVAIATVAVSASAQRQQGRVVNANDYPGPDLGAKINAADKALGASRGEVVVRGGGTISTQVILSSDHTLRLLPGTYVTETTNIPILMKSRSSVVGTGWESILTESTAPGQFTVISAYNQSVLNGKPESDLLIRDLQVKGANPGFHSAPQAISLGNCTGCTVDKVWINGTRAIGIQLGASASGGHFADNSKVINCLFTRVASQNLALANGRNILFEGNRFLKPGQRGGPGTTTIDLEPNEVDDRLENVIIRNNTIDHRDSEVDITGNGIVVQATTGGLHLGPVIIENNTIIGGYTDPPKITNHLSNGIYVFGKMRGVTIRNNQITRTGQAGINIEGDNLVVEGNKLRDVGGGGTAGFIVNARGSRIVNNSITYSGSGPVDNRILLMRDARNNVFERNTGFAAPAN